MAQLSAFVFITLNGYYKGSGDSIDWHRHGGEEAEFSAESLKPGNRLVFGRKTYEMMKSFWPTEMAAQQMPEVAAGMNQSEKIVFSNTLSQPDWQNTRVISGDIVAEMRQLKSTRGKDMTILGSGSIVAQFAAAGLIDSLQIMIDPVAIGGGETLFGNLKNKLDFELLDVRKFQSGVVLFNYQPIQVP